VLDNLGHAIIHCARRAEELNARPPILARKILTHGVVAVQVKVSPPVFPWRPSRLFCDQLTLGLSEVVISEGDVLRADMGADGPLRQVDLSARPVDDHCALAA
jgi:hypothetical protein